MTSAQVSGANAGLMEFMSVVQTNQLAKDSSGEFSKLMEAKSDPNDMTKVDMNSRTGSDSTKETTMESREYDKALKTVDKEEISKSIEDTVEEVKAEIADELDITVEELEAAMQNLGMSDMSLLDVTNLPTLLAELTGEEPIMILTNADLSGKLNNLIQIVNENNLELAKELNVLPEEVMSFVDEMEMITSENLETVEMQTNEGSELVVEQNLASSEKVASTDVMDKGEVKQAETDQNQAKVVMGNQEVTVSITENQNQANTSGNDLGENLANAGSNAEQNEDVNANANIVQNFAEQMLANIEEAVTEITYTSETVDVDGIMNQIVNHVKVGVSSEVTSMELQLQPENLGKLDLQVALKDGKLVAEFTTENEAVKNVIESQLIQLKETLEEQGLKVSSVEVSVEQQGLHQGMDGNQGEQNEYQEAAKQNVRKINLQGIRSLEEIEFEELDEDELITAQLMLQNGNTVDFTA